MKKTTKSEISKEFARLRNFGFSVFNFNFKRALPKGLRYFVDHIIISKRYLIFIEVKIGKDTLDKEQRKLGEILSHLSTMCKPLHYLVITNLKESVSCVDMILEKKL